MPADREITAGFASITTKLDMMEERAAEDRLAGSQARETINEIHGNTQVLKSELKSHIKDDAQKFRLVWWAFGTLGTLGLAVLGYLEVTSK